MYRTPQFNDKKKKKKPSNNPTEKLAKDLNRYVSIYLCMSAKLLQSCPTV